MVSVPGSLSAFRPAHAFREGSSALLWVFLNEENFSAGRLCCSKHRAMGCQKRSVLSCLTEFGAAPMETVIHYER